jgi:phospholipid transport system substrate-binding protein
MLECACCRLGEGTWASRRLSPLPLPRAIFLGAHARAADEFFTRATIEGAELEPLNPNRQAIPSTQCGSIGSWAILVVATLALALFGSRANAGSPPETLIAGMTEQVLTKAAQSQAPLGAAAMQVLVETVIMPNVDFRGMTARAVGPRWRAADDAQKAQLMSGFEALLIKTYAGALSQAADAKFRLRPSITIDSTTQEIRSEVALRGGGDPVALSYRLSLQGDDWKVTDVSVMGVWLVATYRSQFAPVLQNSGVDGLIQVFAAKTRLR